MLTWLVVVPVWLGLFTSVVVADQFSSPPTTQPTTKPARAAQSKTRKKPTTQPTYALSAADRQTLISDLTSSDQTRVTAALKTVKDAAARQGKGFAGPAALAILLDAKRYHDLDTLAVGRILEHPEQTAIVAQCQALRVQALMRGGDKDAALAAAKAYYNLVPFAQTNDAIDLIALCLLSARSSDAGISERFRQQQMAWAEADPATTQPDNDLGEPILPTIKVDSTPFDSAIASRFPVRFNDYLAKANLLLLADRPVDARAVLEIAANHTKRSADLRASIEGVARAIRAENGCIAPANEYIQTMRQSRQ